MRDQSAEVYGAGVQTASEAPCVVRYLREAEAVWVGAAAVVDGDQPEAWSIWRVDLPGRTARRVAAAARGSLDATAHDGCESAAWLSDTQLCVWDPEAGRPAEVPRVGPLVGWSPMRWSPTTRTVAWHGQPTTNAAPVLYLHAVGQPEVERITFPDHAQPVAGAAPVWAGNASAVRIACGAGFTWYLVAWSLEEGRWHIWERPLPEHPEPGDYVPLEDEKWAGHWSQFEVPGGAPVVLGGMQAFEGGFAAYWLFLPDEFRCVGAARDLAFTGLTIGAPTEALKTVAPNLRRVVYIAESGPSGRVLQEAIPGDVPPYAPERCVSLPPDVPLRQEVALTSDNEALVLAGAPGAWRLLRANFASGSVKDLVRLP